jgi:hypothetical protein
MPAAAETKQLQQQHVALPSAVSECYADALSKFCAPDTAPGTDQHQIRHDQQHKVVWQQELTPEAPMVHAAAAAQGSTSKHSSSTAYHTAGSQ